MVSTMSERSVSTVEVNVLAHATEDPAKVRKAALNLFQADAEPPPIEAEELTGYFGDPITALKLVIKHRKPATDLIANVFMCLNSLDRAAILDELPRRIDENKNLYLRLDKQKAYQGRMALSSQDAIRLKAKLHVPHGTDPAEALRAYLEGLPEEAA
jgi:RNA binding exosome subunit